MQQNLFCSFNGNIIRSELSPFLSSNDSFRLRYGVYETYLFQNGQPEYAELHWERLLTGLNILGFKVPEEYIPTFFTQQIISLAARNERTDRSRIRLQIFTDSSSAPFMPQYLIENFDLPASMIAWKEDGIRAGILAGFRKQMDPGFNCKISHNKHFIPARLAMQQSQLDDVLLLNVKGNLIESGMANLFWIKDGTIFTPPLSEGCLAGTIRAVVIDTIKEADIPFCEKAMTRTDLETADEVFLTNSIRKIRWIREINGQCYGNRFLREHLEMLLPA